MRLRTNETDLTKILSWTVDLLEQLDITPVIAGGLAVAAHGYRRETDDVDIVIPMTQQQADQFIDVAVGQGATIQARHAFGGVDLRVPGGRLDVLYLFDPPDLVADAVDESIRSERTIPLLGETVYVVSLGYLIALKMVSERHKDVTDILELIKVAVDESDWLEMRSEISNVLRTHLGWHGTKRFNDLVNQAKIEMGRNIS